MANDNAKKLSAVPAPPPGYPGGAVADNKKKEKDNNAKPKANESTAEAAAAAAEDGDKERGLRIHIDVGGSKGRTPRYGAAGLYSEGVSYSQAQAQEFGGGCYHKQQAATYDREYHAQAHAQRLQQGHGFAPPPARRQLGTVAAGVHRQEYSCNYDEYDKPSNMQLRYNYEAGYDDAAEDDVVVTMGSGGRRYEHGGYAAGGGMKYEQGGGGYQKAWKESSGGRGHAQMRKAQSQSFEQEMEYAESGRGHGEAQMMLMGSHGGAMSDDEYCASKPPPQPWGYYAVQEEYCRRY